MFTAALFMSQKSRNNPNVHRIMDIQSCGISKQWNIIQLQKGTEYDTHYNMDASGKHAKLKMPVTKDHLLYDSIYRCPKGANV